MRITIVTGTFHPEIGGPPRYLYALATALTQRQDHVRVVAFSPVGRVDHDYPFAVRHISRSFAVPWRMLMMADWTLRWGRASDLLYVNDYGLPPVMSNFVLRRPLVMKIVGDFAWEYSVRHGLTTLGIDEFQKRQDRGLQRIQRFYVRRAARVIVPSNYLAGLVRGWGVDADRIRVVYNAVDPQRYVIPVTQAAAKRQLGLSGRLLVTIGRLTPWKGVDALIRLLGRLPADVRLVVVGDGPARPWLTRLAHEEQVSQRVLFVGNVPEQLVTVYLKAADCMALYTGYEGLSHVLLEALLVGTPIVATAKGGNVEVIRSPRDGILVPYGQPERLYQAIANILNDPKLAQQLRQASHERAAAFDWQEMLARTRTVFTEVV